MSLSPETLQIVKDIVGPLVVGVLVNGLLTGLCVAQYIQYFGTATKDKLHVRSVLFISLIQSLPDTQIGYIMAFCGRSVDVRELDCTNLALRGHPFRRHLHSSRFSVDVQLCSHVFNIVRVSRFSGARFSL